jgi:hypothetical protein
MDFAESHFLAQGELTMTDQLIVTQLPLWAFPLATPETSGKQPDLHTLSCEPTIDQAHFGRQRMQHIPAL